MSYDLHGVWDRENPIGSVVLGKHLSPMEPDFSSDIDQRTPT
jgi:hypothetical protein